MKHFVVTACTAALVGGLFFCIQPAPAAAAAAYPNATPEFAVPTDTRTADDYRHHDKRSGKKHRKHSSKQHRSWWS